MELFSEVDTKECKTSVNGCFVQILLVKKDQEASYWPRLTKANGKFNNLTIDWNKYIDEDEENEEASKGLKDFDENSMDRIIFNFRIPRLRRHGRYARNGWHGRHARNGRHGRHARNGWHGHVKNVRDDEGHGRHGRHERHGRHVRYVRQ